jgi:hypothetical protein
MDTPPSNEQPTIETTTRQQPMSLDDLEKRLALLTGAGVRQYEDGGLRIAFGAKRGPVGDETYEEILQRLIVAEGKRG